MRGETLFNVLQWNPNLFQDIVVPSGMEKDMVIDSIIDLCGMLPVAFYEPIFLKRKIDFWFHKELDVFQRLWDSENIDYNPIDDYDMEEKEGTFKQHLQDSTTSIQETLDEDTSIANLRDIDENVTRKQTQDTDNSTVDKISQNADSTSSADTENKVSAFNAAIYSPADSASNEATAKTNSNADASNTFTGRIVGDSTDTTARTDDFHETNSKDTTRERSDSFHDDQRDTSNGWRTKTGRTTDAQSLIEKQRQVVKFCTYDYIARQFMNQFCISVW